LEDEDGRFGVMDGLVGLVREEPIVGFGK